MSGYGGQPPAWNDPYEPNPSGQDPYGQTPQGQAPHGQSPYEQARGWNDPNGPSTQPSWDAYGQPSPYGYGPPGVSQTDGSAPGSTIAALICTSVATGMCCNILAIPGIVTAAVAMSRSRTDPRSTRNLTIWSWVILGVAMALQIILFVVLALLDAGGGSDYGSGGV